MLCTNNRRGNWNLTVYDTLWLRSLSPADTFSHRRDSNLSVPAPPTKKKVESWRHQRHRKRKRFCASNRLNIITTTSAVTMPVIISRLLCYDEGYYAVITHQKIKLEIIKRNPSGQFIDLSTLWHAQVTQVVRLGKKIICFLFFVCVRRDLFELFQGRQLKFDDVLLVMNGWWDPIFQRVQI